MAVPIGGFAILAELARGAIFVSAGTSVRVLSALWLTSMRALGERGAWSCEENVLVTASTCYVDWHKIECRRGIKPYSKDVKAALLGFDEIALAPWVTSRNSIALT